MKTKTTTNNKISELVESRITSICRKYGANAEDTAQAVRLELLEKMQDKHFAKQQPGYHIRFVKWAAAKYQQKASTYDRYVASEPEVADGEGELFAFDELSICADPTVDVEQQVIERQTRREIAAVLATLSPKQAKVCEMLMVGYQPSEIAAELEMSRASVSNITARMQAQMSALMGAVL